MLHGLNYKLELQRLESFVGETITIEGNISEDPQKTARGDTRIALSNIRIVSQQYEGSVWITATSGVYKRGDSITIKDKMAEGFGTFQLSATYVTVLDHVPTNDPLIMLRDNFAASLREFVVEPAASLGIGFVIGQKSTLPPDLEEQLRIVGLTHLVVASGYNLTILIRFAKRIFEKHSKFLVIASSAGLVITFIALSGASPSMVRAGIVAGLSILAWSYGRTFHPVLLILYVAALTAMINPIYLWADIGWWLSFLAFFGVLIVSPLLLHKIYDGKKANTGVQLLSETIAAQIMTLPIILMIFGALPTLAVVANIISAPLIPLAMLLTTAAGVSAMIVPALAPVLTLPAEVLLSYIVAVVRTLSSLEWAMVEVSISPVLIGAIYAIYVATVVFIWKKTKYNFRAQSIID
jgi:competence protein ComEC